MKKKILIVEDEMLVACDLEMTLKGEGYQVIGIADSVGEALEILKKDTPDIILLDIFLKGSQTGIDLGKKLTEKNIPFIYLSANFQDTILEKAKSTEPHGFLVKPFRKNELLVMIEVVIYRAQNGQEAKRRQQQVLETSAELIAKEDIDPEEKLIKLLSSLQPYLPFDLVNFRTDNQQQNMFAGLNLIRKGYDNYNFIDAARYGNVFPTKDTVENTSFLKSGCYDVRQFHDLARQSPVLVKVAEELNLQSLLHFPVLTGDQKIISLTFFSRSTAAFNSDHQNLLRRMSHNFIPVVQEVLSAKNRIKADKSINGARKRSPIFKDIIGESSQMLTILDNITLAAPIDTSILLLGESGTGKERIAECIHLLSPRAKKNMIVLNCATLPANLIESELFGHEKGSFTDASDKRKGKFELADKGTLFLDEIGEMPLDLQVKLLRVLQERQFERVGGQTTLKVDVRIIAATNRNLEKEVKEGRFRLDLYYRLCVFPILLPPLRERKSDISKLVEHFIERTSKRFNKPISGISPEAMEKIKKYQWPGNIRELENYIERNVILCPGPIIEADFLLPFKVYEGTELKSGIKDDDLTMEETIRSQILSALRSCEGKISGEGGAAELLGMPPTTLHSKMKKLNIKKWS